VVALLPVQMIEIKGGRHTATATGGGVGLGDGLSLRLESATPAGRLGVWLAAGSAAGSSATVDMFVMPEVPGL
jgi:hypothetical protein